MGKERLEEEIGIELANLGRLLSEAQELIKRGTDNPDFITSRAAASILHDFYCGIEKVFERMATAHEKSIPVGENWHAELLSQMAKPWKDIRCAVISEEMMNTLKEYMRFRHLFRHIYGFELKWERFKELFLRLEDTHQRLTAEVEGFFKEP